MSAVQTIPAPSTSPSPRPDRGVQEGVFSSTPATSLPSNWPSPAASMPPASAGTSPPHLVTPPLVIGHSPSLPPLAPDQDRIFDALAKGQTNPAELAAALNLPIRHILNLLATPEITFHLQVLENAIDYLARHTTRLRQNLAFKSLESALTVAAAKENPAEIRRIATLLLKPTPPLPDPEAEQAERAERITKHRRAVKNDAKSEQKDAEYAALATAMVLGKATSPSLREGAGGRVPVSPITHSRATDPRSPAGQCSVPASFDTQAAPVSPLAPGTRLGRKPGLLPPDASTQPSASAPPTTSAPQSPSHRVTVSPSHASPAQPRAA